MSKCSALIVIVLVAIGLVFGTGCSSTMRTGDREYPVDTARFAKPDTDAKNAAKELGKRLEVYQNELNCAREQLAVLRAVRATLDDPQLPGAIAVIEQRVAQLELSVADLSRRHERAVAAASQGSYEDFTMSLREAPELPHDSVRDSRDVLSQLGGRYQQLNREIQALALHISNAEVEMERRGDENRSLGMQYEIDQARHDSLVEEFLKTEWRVAIAQCAVNYRSRLDLSTLLTQPESSQDGAISHARRGD
ncbi:MAG: hypothetical protein KDD66_07420 [Bdellovibrionales bacterium]|nr:hypothetical protein [Bdellovibrionales bacterium]